jgi:hypothetical protein
MVVEVVVLVVKDVIVQVVLLDHAIHVQQESIILILEELLVIVVEQVTQMVDLKPVV